MYILYYLRHHLKHVVNTFKHHIKKRKYTKIVFAVLFSNFLVSVNFVNILSIIQFFFVVAFLCHVQNPPEQNLPSKIR